jgi:hypothetical protein
MKIFPLDIGITDSNFNFKNCSTFLITFPTNDEFAINSKIGWNPWGYTFSFVYNFQNGLVVMCDDYLTIKIDESIDDALDALKVYEYGPEWQLEYRQDVNSWIPAEFIPSKTIPNFGKWKKNKHILNQNDICFTSSGIEDTYVGGEQYNEGSNLKIDDFYNHIFGEGFKTLVEVSNSVVDKLSK